MTAGGPSTQLNSGGHPSDTSGMRIPAASPAEDGPPTGATTGGRHRRGAPPRAIRQTDPTHQPIPLDILASLEVLPCDVFLGYAGRYVLYAATGGDARDVVAHAGGNAELAIRVEDRDVLRRGLSRSVGRILGDESRTPVERSRRAYAAVGYVMSPIFKASGPLDRDDLEDATDAIDALVARLSGMDSLVWSMVATMSKHLATHTHAINTAVYAVLLGGAMREFQGDSIRDIGRGALLHDIGKNRIPLEILDKPGPLDEEEWRRMREHPTVGHRMVVGALGVEPSYAHIISEHHERADGSGYPSGVRGRAIPPDSRLVAIADAYDALTSARSYKPAGSSYNALWTMRFQMRGQFDARILEALAALLGGWKALRRADVRSLELAAAV